MIRYVKGGHVMLLSRGVMVAPLTHFLASLTLITSTLGTQTIQIMFMFDNLKVLARRVCTS